MSRVRLWERLMGVGVDMASSGRLLVEALRVRDLRRVLAAYLGFTVAEMANFIAILIYAYEVGGSPALGLVAFLTLAPAAVFAPVGATLGDRFRREVMLTMAYALFAATTALVAIALYADWPVGVIYLLAAANATVLTLVRPFHESLLPALARTTEQLAAGYVAGGTIENLGLIVGPLMAGLTAAAWGTGAAFVITTVLLLLGTFLVWGVQTRTAADPGTGQNAVQMTLEGFGAFRESRPLVILVLLNSVIFLSGVLDVAIIVLAFEVFGSDDTGTAWLNAMIGVGAAAGSVLAVVLIGRRHLASSMGRGLVLIAVSVSMIPIFRSQAAALVTLAVMGAGWTFVDVSGRIMLQRVIPLGGLSRAFGVLEGSSMAAEALGSAAGAVLIGWLGVGWALVIAGLLIIVLLLVNRRALQDADVGVVVPIEHLHLLRSIPMFAALGPAELERLATSADEESVGPGSAVCVQGEPGERFYLVERGTARVVRDGTDVATLGFGDFFGEIALLRDIPRTATVEAVSDLDLLVLERGPFLDAIKSSACQIEAARAVSQTRIDELGM
ncbi:MAG TPA: MFS transporter [Acidimicrobiia bacterium]|nr:MFS transporter [Acidimicrobiia bacterium]